MTRVPGRDYECDQLEALLGAVRNGAGRALVVRGEPGVGKSTLLDYLVGRARGFRTARVTGIRAETELAFAGLHQLCAPLADHIGSLPPAQRDALSGALGQGSERAPDSFHVALGTLGLLSGAPPHDHRPVLWVVDDAQWLDRASLRALAFVARRLGTEPVALVFALRTDPATAWPPEPAAAPPNGPPELPPAELLPAGLPELPLTGLADQEAEALLRTALTGPWDSQVLGRIVAEARGNPLALLDLPRRSTPVELAGGFGLPRPVGDRVRAAQVQQIAGLPSPTRLFLLAAAADPTGEPALLWRAAEHLGTGVDAAGSAVAAGLVEIGHRVRFVHSEIRSYVYWAASPEERRRTHRVLAQVTDARQDGDRRTWHAAHGVPGPDEAVAAELERSARLARRRGGPAAAGAFLAKAVDLTSDPVLRQERALVAARATHEAGSPGTALRLLSLAGAGPLGPLGPRDEGLRGRTELMRARIAFTTYRGGDAPGLLFTAAGRIEPHDPALARETYLEAIEAAMFTGPPAFDAGHVEAAEAARAAPPALRPRPADLLLDGIATRIVDGHTAALPALKRALPAFTGPGLSAEEGLRWLWPAGVTAVGVWDDAAWAELAARHVRLAREAGHATVLPLALTMRCAVHVLAGELVLAESVVTEIRRVSEALGTAPPVYGALLLSAWQGDEGRWADLDRSAVDGAFHRGEGAGPVVSGWARALLCNSLGRYAEALKAAGDVVSQYRVLEMGPPTWALGEYVEAAVRSGDRAAAAVALRRLTEVTGPSATDWALGIEARSRALLASANQTTGQTTGRAAGQATSQAGDQDGDRTEDRTEEQSGDQAKDLAERHYREAVDRLRRTRARGELARAHLLFGEWLRREKRRRAAREHLRAAHDGFATMGMRAFAQRAARELRATGESTRRRPTAAAADTSGTADAVNGPHVHAHTHTYTHPHAHIDTAVELTAQESQIVRLVREGLTNTEIGARLFLSPRTVEWHLGKVFGKLGVSSRKQLQGS
ncbi:AAA family ATPase [Streptomyces sp. CWNU-52B]|uniref:helix-turn-helix transcriptional regulator n=1 Tax=unclassified Streptomyces TaxID=2593676 RepID=UPI0039C0A0A7